MLVSALAKWAVAPLAAACIVAAGNAFALEDPFAASRLQDSLPQSVDDSIEDPAASEPFDGQATISTPPLSQNEADLPTLRAGVFYDTGPYSFTREGFSGIDVDMIRAAALRMGYQVDFVAATQARLIRMVLDSEIDFMVSHGIPDPVCIMTQWVSIWGDALVAMPAVGAKSIADLDKHRIAAYPQGVDWLTGFLADHGAANAEVQAVRGTASGVPLLTSDRIDALLGDLRIIQYHASLHGLNPDDDLVVVHKFPDDFHGLCVREPDIAAGLDEALGAIKAEGGYEAVLARYRPAP